MDIVNATSDSFAQILPGIFTDSRFQELSRYRLFGEIDGVKVGVVLATKTPRYELFALNRGDFERLLAGKSAGKLDQAFVVLAKINGLGAATYWDHTSAEQMHDIVKGLRPRNGAFGEFWTLPPNVVTAGVTSSDDEPF